MKFLVIIFIMKLIAQINIFKSVISYFVYLVAFIYIYIFVEILGFVLSKLKGKYISFLKTPLFAFDVKHQCDFVSNTWEEDSFHITNLVIFSREPQPTPTQKIEEYPWSGF